MCAWGNFDKEEIQKENWVSYEMPPCVDYSIFKQVVITCCFKIEILESLEGWEEFLEYCKAGA